MRTQDILKDIIRRLYNESIRNGFNFTISPYGTNSYLEAEDGTFIGSLSNRYNSNSIFNPYGNYGSRYSSLSIFNPYGNYGSRYSSLSPVNAYTSTPPKIFINGTYYGRLTINRYVPNARPTDAFLFYVMNQLNVLDDRIDDLVDIINRI